MDEDEAPPGAADEQRPRTEAAVKPSVRTEAKRSERKSFCWSGEPSSSSYSSPPLSPSPPPQLRPPPPPPASSHAACRLLDTGAVESYRATAAAGNSRSSGLSEESLRSPPSALRPWTPTLRQRVGVGLQHQQSTGGRSLSLSLSVSLWCERN